MNREELRQLIDEVQKRQSEFDHVEVKASRGGHRSGCMSRYRHLLTEQGVVYCCSVWMNLKIFQLSASETLIGYRRT